MDNAVALVQAYLRLNGYFTVSECPVVEPLRPGNVRTMTDLDILGFRFPARASSWHAVEHPATFIASSPIRLSQEPPTARICSSAK